MRTADFLEQLAADGALLAETAARADLDAPVPGLTLSLREVVVHTGAVHRWAADLVRRELTSNETAGSAAFRADVADDDLTAWITEGLAALVGTLADAPPDLEVWAFGPLRPAGRFWSRRQAHETAVHRADVQAAAGEPVTPFPVEFAQDGLAELFRFARSFPGGRPARLALLASDGDDWLITFDHAHIAAAPAVEVGDIAATVTGTSSDLYRWAWNRPSPAVVTGDSAVVDLWRNVRIT